MLFLVCVSNLFLKVSTDGGFASSGQVVMTPKVGWQVGKADRGGEPVNHKELGARARECDKKNKKVKNLSCNIYRKNPKNVGRKIQKPEQACFSEAS